jgi:large subunit ribosomal protein L30
MAEKAKDRLRVTQVRSANNRTKDQQATLVGLGLGRLHRTRDVADTPSMRGMIAKVKHLVKVESAS